VIRDNHVDEYQKTAIVVHGNVEATIENNQVGSSVADPVIAPNGIQIGPQASARIRNNHIAGNFTSQAAAGHAGSAILLKRSGPGTIVDHNLIEGDEDVGIYIDADGASITDNVVRDFGGSERMDEVGIVNYGTANLIISNTVTGFRTSYYGVDAPSPASRGLQIE
jgi:Right handed beta helix region